MWVKSLHFTIQNKLQTILWGERKHTSPGKCEAHALVDNNWTGLFNTVKEKCALQIESANYLSNETFLMKYKMLYDRKVQLQASQFYGHTGGAMWRSCGLYCSCGFYFVVFIIDGNLSWRGTNLNFCLNEGTLQEGGHSIEGGSYWETISLCTDLTVVKA